MEEERKWIDVILNTSDIYKYVQRRTSENDKKRKRVLDYLNLLKKNESICLKNRGSRFENLYRNIFFYRKYVIKEKDIPESYFAGLINAAKEEGRVLEFTDEDKKEIKTSIIYDQKRTIDEWIDYFTYGNGRFYEMYKQFWAFQGLQKLGDFDKKTLTFGKKNKNTVNPIPHLDEAALESTISLMERYIKDGIVVDDIKNGFTSYNFKSLYEYSLREVMKRRNNKTKEGIWKKYEKNSDYKLLVKDIRGKYTGWCTERDTWAKDYLSKSDFHIFYTKDSEGKYTNPRITIRVIDNEVVEIRGIDPNQNVEFDMFDKLHEKMKEFDFSEDFFEKEVNMKYLTLIYKKSKKGIELDREELKFLYQIDKVINGFGNDIDPRINDIIKTRDIKKDLSIIFDVSKDEVALAKEELNDNTKVFFGTLDYYMDTDLILTCNDEEYKVDKVIIPKYIVGSMFLNVPYENVEMPKLVTGSFGVFCPKLLNKLSLPKVGVHLSVYKLEDALEIEVGDHPIYDINFYDLVNCGKIKLPSTIKGTVKFEKLLSLDEIHFPKKMRRSIYMPQLYSCDDLLLPKVIKENLVIPNLKTNAPLPDKVGGIMKVENSLKERSVIK
ncbi:MAG: hypothetical protein IKF01_01535 [Bacilli bacterium]|nr:hypothetical protein [Bacilli bacterium]